MENLLQIPRVSVSVLSLRDSPGDGTDDWEAVKTLRDAFRIIPKASPEPRLLRQGASELAVSISLEGLKSRGVKRGIGQQRWGWCLRPYSSLPDYIATQACLQSLPLPTAQFDQIRAPSRCGSARGQEDTRRGQQ